MKEFWNTIQLVFTAVGGWLGYFLGGYDGLLYALVVFMVADYLTGVMCAINDQKLSSLVGFRGICRKVMPEGLPVIMVIRSICGISLAWDIQWMDSVRR